MNVELFENIDTVFARKVLESSYFDETCFIALSYLFASSRQGHHCVSIDQQTLKPSPEKVLENVGSIQIFSDKVIEGLKRLPKGIVQEGLQKLNLKPIVKENSHYYLQKYFFLEREIATNIENLSKAPLKIAFSREEIEEELALHSTFLNKEQEEAILNSLSRPMHLLTGGPGTGKTYTIFYLLQIYKALCKRHHYNPRIILAAPTGKATSHLKDKFLNEQEKSIEINTLHSALKIKKKEDFHKEQHLFKDLIVVDECSMIDLHLWRVLLSAIQEGTRVVLMGDHDQLPPVETGMIFEQLMKVLPCSYLKKCMRTERQELLKLAEAIREKKEFVLEECLRRNTEEIQYYEYEREQDLFSLGIDSLKPGFFSDNTMSYVILSPILQGPWGVETINEKLYSFFLDQMPYRAMLEIPIMITKTDYAQDLYNGDRGILVKHADMQSKDYVFFESKEKKIPLAFLSSYQYAYALSVHKSQGSEYDRVLLLLPEGSQRFGKEVLYTAVTRAKKTITILSKKGVFKQCLEMEAKKNSALSERIVLNRK